MANDNFIKFNDGYNAGLYMGDYLSQNPAVRQAQINFINSDTTDQQKWISDNTEINKSIANTDINKYEIAKSVYDLKKINSLQPLIAKTTIQVNGYFDKTTDTLGSSILNQMDKLVNAAEAGLDAITSKLEGYKNNIVDAKIKYVDRTLEPCTGWASKKLNNFSSSFVDDLHTFNQGMAKSRLLNTPGDAFNSMRHIAFALKGDLAKLIDFTHQVFAGISAAIVKLIRLIRKTIKVVTKILVNLIQSLIPTSFLESIASSINTLLGGFGETIDTFFNSAGLETTTGIFDGLQTEITSFASEPLTYLLGELDVTSYINIPGVNSIAALENKLLSPLNNITKFADSLTLESLIKKLPKDAQSFLNVMNQIATNAHGFVGGGVRSYVRKKLLGNKRSTMLGSTKKIGLKFTLSEPYHYATNNTKSTTPYLTFKKLITDNNKNSMSVSVDRYGNKLNYLSYTQTHLF